MSKPKVAICFAGLPSYIDHNKAHWQELIDRYDADVYASLWGNEERLYNENDTINNFVDSYKPIKLELENYENVQNNTFRHLAEDVTNHREEGRSWQDTFAESYKRDKAAIECAALSGRFFSIFYKVWKANLLKDSLGRKYDIVVRAETCSSYPNLSLDRVDDYKGAQDCINIPYFLERYLYKPKDLPEEMRNVLVTWLAFGPPDLMDYYCSAFLYLKKYFSEIVCQPPNNTYIHHLLNRPNIRMRLFFNRILRKGIEHWNGHANGVEAHKNHGEGDISHKIDKNSHHTTISGFRNHSLLKTSLPVKVNYFNKEEINKVTWPNGRPEQNKVEPESTYVDLDSRRAGSEHSRAERNLREQHVPGFNVKLGQDKYGNFYPKYTKK